MTMSGFYTKGATVGLRCQLLLVAVLAVVAVQHCAAQEQTTSPTFYSCYGRPCEVGEYCSNSEPFRGCRPCTNLSVWCTRNISHVRENFFPCLHTCEALLTKQELEIKLGTLQKNVEKMTEKLIHLENNGTVVNQELQELREEDEKIKEAERDIERKGIVNLVLLVTACVLPFVLAFFLMWCWVSRAECHLDRERAGQTAALRKGSLLHTLRTVCYILCLLCPTRRPHYALQRDQESCGLQTFTAPTAPVDDDADDSGNSSHSGSSDSIV